MRDQHEWAGGRSLCPFTQTSLVEYAILDCDSAMHRSRTAGSPPSRLYTVEKSRGGGERDLPTSGSTTSISSITGMDTSGGCPSSCMVSHCTTPEAGAPHCVAGTWATKAANARHSCTLKANRN